MTFDDFLWKMINEPFIDHVEGSWVMIYAIFCALFILFIGYCATKKYNEVSKGLIWTVTILFTAFTLWGWHTLYGIIV